MSIQFGRCVVCGKDCHTRCGPCASKGLNWMYFCGQEHQKLIWHTHKRVCGKEKWEWPKPTKTEQKWIEEHGGYIAGLEVNPTARKMMDEMDPVAQEFVHFASSIATGTSPLSPLLEKCNPEAALENMQYSRRVAFQVRCIKDSPSGPPVEPEALFKHLSIDPFGALTHFEDLKWEPLSTSRPTSYFSNVHHRLLIFFTLLGLSYDNPTEPEHLALIRSSFEHVRSLLEKAEESMRAEANGLIVALATLASDCLHSKDGR